MTLKEYCEKLIVAYGESSLVLMHSIPTDGSTYYATVEVVPPLTREQLEGRIAEIACDPFSPIGNIRECREYRRRFLTTTNPPSPMPSGDGAPAVPATEGGAAKFCCEPGTCAFCDAFKQQHGSRFKSEASNA